MHPTGVMKAMPRPAWLRDRYRGQAITQTPLQFVRHRRNGTATAANPTASVQCHRYRGDCTAIAPMAPLPRDTNCTKSRKILRILLLQCSHGRVIENPAVNRPLRVPNFFFVSSAKICNIFSPRSAPTFIMHGEIEHSWYF